MFCGSVGQCVFSGPVKLPLLGMSGSYGQLTDCRAAEASGVIVQLSVSVRVTGLCILHGQQAILSFFMWWARDSKSSEAEAAQLLET